jgi:hypothetical protein
MSTLDPSVALATWPARSGCFASTPESTTATTMSKPVDFLCTSVSASTPICHSRLRARSGSAAWAATGTVSNEPTTANSNTIARTPEE